MAKNNYLKSGVWYMIGNLLIKGITFFTLPIFTRILTTSDFGKFNLFVSYESILNVILGLGIAGTIKTAYFDYKEEFEQYYSSILSLLFLFSLAVDIILNFALLFFKNYLDELWGYGTVNLLVACSLATALYNVISMRYVIEVEYKKNLAMSFVYTISSVLISLSLCLGIFATNRYMARIIGNAIPLILITYLISICQIIKGKTIIHKQYWKYALSMGIPLIFHSLSLVIMQQADKIMVDAFCGNEMTGIYSLACNISMILTIVQSSIDSSWAPWFYSNLNKNRYTVLCKNNRLVVFLFLYLTAGFILISPELVYITSPIEYHSAIFALIPLNVSVFVSFMYMFAVNKEYYHKRTRTIAIGTIISTGVDVILNVFLIPRFGFISAAYTTLISKVVLFAIHWVVSNKIDNNKVVMTKDLLTAFFLVMVIATISVVCRNLLIIRYVVILMMTICMYFMLKKNKISINSLRRKP